MLRVWVLLYSSLLGCVTIEKISPRPLLVLLWRKTHPLPCYRARRRQVCCEANLSRNKGEWDHTIVGGGDLFIYIIIYYKNIYNIVSERIPVAECGIHKESFVTVCVCRGNLDPWEVSPRRTASSWGQWLGQEPDRNWLTYSLHYCGLNASLIAHRNTTSANQFISIHCWGINVTVDLVLIRRRTYILPAS